MREALMGIEVEYGLRFDEGKAHGDFPNDLAKFYAHILKQSARILPEGHFYERDSRTGEFWTRAGMRCYPDRQNNLEMAIPECASFADAVFQRNAGDRLMQALVDSARRSFQNESSGYVGPLEIYANNTAASRFAATPTEVSFSCHENYLLRRDLLKEKGESTPFDLIAQNAMAFFAALPVISGSGHITPDGVFVLSPRMEWMRCAIGATTTEGRPIVNTRDEPHADRERFIRYHHIAGDTNITDHILLMKMAFTYWVLRVIERGWRSPEWLRIPVSAAKPFADAINRDPCLAQKHEIGGKRLSAVDILSVYLRAIKKHRADILFEDEDERILREIKTYLEYARGGFRALFGKSEWATKYFLIAEKAERERLATFNHPTLKACSIAFHNLDQNPEKNPFIRIRNRVLPPNMDIGDLAKACAKAPRTRAFVRGLAVFLAKKYRIPILFPSGLEWSEITFPDINKGTVSLKFSLNQKAPWQCGREDIGALIDCVRPLIPLNGVFTAKASSAQNVNPPQNVAQNYYDYGDG